MKGKCTGMAIVGQQCPHDAIWRNQNGVEVCDYHRSLLEAFSYPNKPQWSKIPQLTHGTGISLKGSLFSQ